LYASLPVLHIWPPGQGAVGLAQHGFSRQREKGCRCQQPFEKLPVFQEETEGLKRGRASFSEGLRARQLLALLQFLLCHLSACMLEMSPKERIHVYPVIPGRAVKGRGTLERARSLPQELNHSAGLWRAKACSCSTASCPSSELSSPFEFAHCSSRACRSRPRGETARENDWGRESCYLLNAVGGWPRVFVPDSFLAFFNDFFAIWSPP